MPLSKPRTIFGIHEAVLYRIESGLPYGTLRVLAGSTLTLAGELVPLTGGSSKYIWDAQDGNIGAELSLKPKELPSFLFKVLLGKTPTETLADPGNTANSANVLNSSVLDATTGIASVGVTTGDEDDLKFGKYIVKAVSPTTVDIFALTNVDFFRGVDKQYLDDSLKINATPLSITMGGTTTVDDFGFEFVGGSGTIAMVAGDTAEFDINPPSLSQTDVKVGELEECIPEFGAVLTAQKQSDGSMWLFDCFRVKAIGFPFGMEEKAYNEAEITAMLMFDSIKNGVFNARHIIPTIACD